MNDPRYDCEVPPYASMIAVPSENSSLTQQFEALTSAAKKMEESFLKERNYSRQLREYAEKLAAEIQKFQQRESQHRNQISVLQNRESLSVSNIRALTSELARLRQELERFHKIQSDINAKDQTAQRAIDENVKLKRSNEQLENDLRNVHQSYLSDKSKIEESEKMAGRYRAELQDALVHLHATEAKFSELSKEVQALDQARKNRQLELAKIEQACRDRYELQMKSEKERILAESEAEKIKISREAVQKTESELEAKHGREQEKIKSEFKNYFAEERKKAEEAYSKMLRDKEKSISQISQERNEAKLRLAQVEKTKDELFAKLNSLEMDLAVKEKKLKLSKTENQTYQDILVAEKKKWKELADHICMEAARNSSYSQTVPVLEVSGLVELLRANSKIKIISPEPKTQKNGHLIPPPRLDC